jgi:uncharacterized protein YbaP (TraB family)
MLRALLCMLVVACASKPACPVVPLPATPGPAFLWRVQKDAGVVWLFGTIHDAGLDLVPPVALDAFAGATRIATELGDEPPDVDTFRRYARIASGPGLDHQLSSDDWYDLREALRGVVKEDDLRRAQPWYAMTRLSTKAAPPGKSMDILLVERASERSMPVDALERWEDQLAMLSKTVKIADLVEAIHARATMHCDHGRLRASYAAGDTEAMTALLVVPAHAEQMLYVRNRAWLPTVERYLAGDGAFVAVGLGHLLGEQGLPSLLARAGYRVERVTKTGARQVR